MCVQASISVYFCSPKTHSHLNAGDRTHLPALWAVRQLSQNILYTHARIRLPGVPHMQRPGSAKWNFLKAKNTSPEQTSLLNNTTLGFLSPHLRQAVIIYKGRVFGLLLWKGRAGCFWHREALQHDGWQIDCKLFWIWAVCQCIYFYIEIKKGQTTWWNSFLILDPERLVSFGC